MADHVHVAVARAEWKDCDGTHNHGQTRGQSLKDAESYSYEMTDAIHRDWKQHVAKTADRVLPNKEAFALCCLVGSNPTPVTIMATMGEQNRAFWHEVMWSPGGGIPGRLRR